jgi:putative ABC transport system permease protein
MSTVVLDRPLVLGAGDGGRPARRAMVHWAWRMFRREWRRQTLVLALLVVAVAATTVGLALVSNATQLHDDPVFGTANTIFTVSGSPSQVNADVAALQGAFGRVDVVAHQSVPVPGSVSSIDVRAMNPAGPYVGATLRLDAGRYPSGANEVALTDGAARTFGLHIGSNWVEGGRTLQVVGLVENPLNLQDEFALVAPGQISSPASVSLLVDASPHILQSFRLPDGNGVGVSQRGSSSQTAAEAVVLVMATVGLLFVGLLAVAGFAVMAQRRLRALGMLGSLGATDRHVRLVMLANGAAVGATASVVGALLGLAAWLVFAPLMQSIVEHRIDRFALPWWAVAATLVLAFVTAVVAAWWPARSAARMPIVAALSGRPPRPQPAHRFAAAGGILLGTGIVLLAFADQRRQGFIIAGTIVTVVGLLLFAPLAIRAIAGTASHWPIAVRLAWRDLARYQARSGAALGAVTLALGIAATIAISAAAAQIPHPIPNLPSNELILYVGSGAPSPGNPVPVVSGAQRQSLQARVDQLAASLHARTALPLEAAYNPAAPPVTGPPGQGSQPPGQVTATLSRVTRVDRGESVEPVAALYVATPALLQQYGIKASSIDPAADVISSRTDLGGLQIFLPVIGPVPGRDAAGPPQLPPAMNAAITHPTIQLISQFPPDTSEPNTLLTAHGMQVLGLQALPAGFLIETPHALTAAQIQTAQKMAAAAGLAVETRSTPKSLAPLRNWSTAAGILVALGVLAMTVGLIRSETARDLRTLSATGASSSTRRTLTGATAGALALLGAILGTAGAYAALLAWHRSNLHPLTHVPVANLLIIIVGLPLIATTAGWLLAGREPAAIARQPLD